MSIQGHLLCRGLLENGVECYPAHYQDRKTEREWFYKSFKPDAVIGIGWWVDTPTIIKEPQSFGLIPTPWLLSDGWVANYHDVISSLPLVFVTSNWVAENYQRDGVDTKNFEVLHVGYDAKKFRPIPKDHPGVIEARKMFGIREDEKMILTVGGDVTSKGAQEMIQALVKVDKEYPNFKYVCKSTNSECAINHHREELDLMQKAGLSPSKVIYCGENFDREFMPYLLNACDIYAAPSRIEGFGMVQVEAMACGKPVISIDAMGPKETIIHGETGFLAKVGTTVDLPEELATYEMGFDEEFKIKFDQPKIFAYRADIDDLAKFTLDLLTNDDLRNKIGERAAKHTLDNFQYQNLAKKCVEILQEKLNL
ncbi:glycosyltransferase [Patescibacteria group bacterium]|nr:glycosyltransferase [Patescibacteria group bacterium]MCG2692517.1 glycosyltransferase [Candidatus Parcubacteria bacterium]